MILQSGSMVWISTAACRFPRLFSFSFSSFCRVRESWNILLLGVMIDTDTRTRPGERVAKRRRCKSKVGASHRIDQTETIKWFKNRFEGIVRGDR